MPKAFLILIEGKKNGRRKKREALSASLHLRRLFRFPPISHNLIHLAELKIENFDCICDLLGL